MDGTCYWCVLRFKTFMFSRSKKERLGGGGVVVYDPYHGKATCFATAEVCFIQPYSDRGGGQLCLH